MDGGHYARCRAALEPVLRSVAEAQAAVTAVKVEAEAEAEVDAVAAEVDAVTTQLAELKGMVQNAQAALESVHVGRRKWSHVAVWTGVLLALPLAFVATLELTGESDAADFVDDCEGVSGLTCFVNVSILVWLCALVVRRKLLPVWWPRTHAALPTAKRDKAVGYAIKTLFRFVALVMLLYLWQYWSLSEGLRMGGGPVFVSSAPTASATPPTTPPPTPPATPAYCTGTHGAARRLWHSSKIFFLTVMVWELSFLPSSPWDMWLHHIGLILGVAFSTDHSLRQLVSGASAAGPTAAGEALDGFAYLLMLGTAFMFLKELLVLAFQHRKASNVSAQSADLWWAAAVHLLGQATFYLTLPAVYLGFSLSRGRMPWRSGALLITLLLVLNLLEAYIFSVTLKVMLAKRAKARAAAARARLREHQGAAAMVSASTAPAPHEHIAIAINAPPAARSTPMRSPLLGS